MLRPPRIGFVCTWNVQIAPRPVGVGGGRCTRLYPHTPALIDSSLFSAFVLRYTQWILDFTFRRSTELILSYLLAIDELVSSWVLCVVFDLTLSYEIFLFYSVFNISLRSAVTSWLLTLKNVYWLRKAILIISLHMSQG